MVLIDKSNINTILLAEDDEDDYLLIEEAMNDINLVEKIIWVRNGEDLIDFLCVRGKFSERCDIKKPNIILLDLNMPKKDGREVLKEIDSNPEWKSIVVIVFTSSKAVEDITYSYKFGANSYVQKPSGFEHFTKVIKKVFEYWTYVSKLDK